MKVASMVTGILSILFCSVPIVGVVLGIVAVCTARYSREDGKIPGMGVAGLACGIVGLCLSVIATGCTMCAVCAAMSA